MSTPSPRYPGLVMLGRMVKPDQLALLDSVPWSVIGYAFPIQDLLQTLGLN